MALSPIQLKEQDNKNKTAVGLEVGGNGEGGLDKI